MDALLFQLLLLFWNVGGAWISVVRDDCTTAAAGAQRDVPLPGPKVLCWRCPGEEWCAGMEGLSIPKSGLICLTF